MTRLLHRFPVRQLRGGPQLTAAAHLSAGPQLSGVGAGRWVCLLFLLAACSAPRAPAISPSVTPPSSASAAPRATPTAAPTATITHLPTPTLTPSLTPTPAPPQAVQLTRGGCCVQPFWSPDSRAVWYIDRPQPDAPAGMWGVSIDGGAPYLVSARIGYYSPDMRLLYYLDGGRTHIERVDTGERWVAQAQGRAISISPDNTQLAWQAAASATNFDRRPVEIWTAAIDGTSPRRLAQLSGGSLAGWLPDGAGLLVSARDDAAGQAVLSRLNLADGALTPLVRGPRFRGLALAPGGEWLAYQITFSGDPAQDGLWVVRLDGSAARRLDVFGAYRWRDGAHLLVIPLEMDAGGQRLLEVDAACGAVRALTDPALTPLPIAGGDWALAPDGQRLVFVSAVDHNLWLLELPR